MAKLIIMLSLGFSIFWFYRKVTAALKNNAELPEITKKKMTQCSHCEVYFPKDGKHIQGGKEFCSQEHMALFITKERDVNAETKTGQTHDNPHD